MDNLEDGRGEEWEAERKRLSEAVRTAALAYLNFMEGSSAFRIPFHHPTMGMIYVIAGAPAELMALAARKPTGPEAEGPDAEPDSSH